MKGFSWYGVRIMAEPTSTIRDLYPNCTEEELAKAEENFERYLGLVLQIYERLESQGELSEIDEHTEK